MAKNHADFKFSEKDIEIIKILENDGRMPLLKLAKKVGLSHETIRYKINRLLKAGVIQKFTVRINKRALGYQIYGVVLIAISNYTKENWDEFFNFLMQHPNIVNVEKVTGNYDLKFAFWAKDTEDFDRISHAIKIRFSKIIKDWNSFIFTNRFKTKELPF
ncbi:MAG: Lrp/AsnC family transcriptional regulator [Nanoarchaeota archaeon]